MILYFSGTGNSEYVAKRIGKVTADEVINLFDRIRARDFADVYSDHPWVVVAPTYAWRIPRILREWLEQTNLCGSKDIYFVMTCGGNIGNAGKYLKELCDSKRMNYLGCAAIVMPENYIAMFSTPTRENALKTIGQAKGAIETVAHQIKTSEMIPHSVPTVKDKMNSGMINDLFYPVFVRAKKFYTKGTCISCGKCVAMCPLKNIHIESGKPVWGKNCTHCMACICRCPSEAIEYGKHSEGMERYTCPD